MSNPTGSDVCEYLRNVCTLPENILVDSLPVEAVDSYWRESETESEQRELHISKQFTIDFNNKVESLFGRYEAEGSALTSDKNDVSDELVDQGGIEHEEEKVADGVSKPRFIPGKLQELFQMHCDWGRDLRCVFISTVYVLLHPNCYCAS